MCLLRVTGVSSTRCKLIDDLLNNFIATTSSLDENMSKVGENQLPQNRKSPNFVPRWTVSM